jgi:hypothetical protein
MGQPPKGETTGAAIVTRMIQRQSPGIFSQWRNANGMRETVASYSRVNPISGWSEQITACPASCRAAAPVPFGMTRKDANTRINQRLVIVACIISRRSMDIATVWKHNGNWENLWTRGRTKSKTFNRPTMRFGDRLKNPRAALTLPGGDLITAIVKQKMNSDQYDKRCPVAVHYDHIGQGLT